MCKKEVRKKTWRANLSKCLRRSILNFTRPFFPPYHYSNVSLPPTTVNYEARKNIHFFLLIPCLGKEGQRPPSFKWAFSAEAAARKAIINVEQANGSPPNLPRSTLSSAAAHK